MLATHAHPNRSLLVLTRAAAIAGALSAFAAPAAPAATPGTASANPTEPVEVRPFAPDSLTVGDVILPAAPPTPPALNAPAADSSALGAAQSRPLGGQADAQPVAPREPERSSGWFARTLLALGAVIAIIFALRFVVVRATRGATGLAAQLGPGGRAPSGVLSVLARYPVARAQSLVLLKVDRRVLLACQTAAGFTTLSEITDPEDVAAILMKAEDEEGSTISRRFRSLLARFDRDPALAPEIVDARPSRGLPHSPERSSLAPPPDADAPPAHADPRLAVRRRLASLREQTA